MNRSRKYFAGIALAAVAALPLAACSSTDSASSSSSSSSDVKIAKPIARINALSGDTTAVLLDTGFTDALTSLGLTPGVVGEGDLVDGSLVFPITGGNVTVFDKTEAKPYVIGQVQHEGSGFSLEAGDTKVEITNLNVDPGVSRVYGDVAVNGKSPRPARSSSSCAAPPSSPCRPRATPPSSKAPRSSSPRSPLSCSTAPSSTDAVTDQLLVGIAKITVNTTPAS